MLSLIRAGVVYSGQGIFSGFLFACPAWAVLCGHPCTLASLCPWSNVGFPVKRAACTLMQGLWTSSHIFWSSALSSIHRDGSTSHCPWSGAGYGSSQQNQLWKSLPAVGTALSQLLHPPSSRSQGIPCSPNPKMTLGHHLTPHRGSSHGSC